MAQAMRRPLNEGETQRFLISLPEAENPAHAPSYMTVLVGPAGGDSRSFLYDAPRDSPTRRRTELKWKPIKAGECDVDPVRV